MGDAIVLALASTSSTDNDVAPRRCHAYPRRCRRPPSRPRCLPYTRRSCPTGEYLFRLWAEAEAAWTVKQSGTSIASGTLTEAAVDFRDWVCLADGSYDVEVTGLDSEAHWRLDDVRGNSAVSKGPKHCS